MTAEPEQWAVELWAEMYAAVYGCEPTHPAHMYGNAHRILQRAFEERTGQLIPAPSVETVVVPRKLTLEMETAGIDASLDHFIMDRVTVEGLHKFYEAAISAMGVKP